MDQCLVLERWDRVGVMDSPAGYAYRTALNLRGKRIRRLAVRAERRFAPVPVADIGPAASDRHDVRRALQELPDGLRAALILVGWFDMSGSVSRIRRSRRHPSAGAP